MEPFPGVEAKVQEYALRILNGEDPDKVLEGAETFRALVEERVNQYRDSKEKKILEEEQVPKHVHYIPDHAVKARIADDTNRIEQIKKEINKDFLELSSDEIEQRKTLSGWPASYKLASIAKERGIDLSLLSREEYAQFAIDNYLAIDDDQLRTQPWQRNEESVESIVKKNRELRAHILPEVEKSFATFSHSMMELAKKDQTERYLADNVRVLSGTKDSNSWLFFSINNGTNAAESDTYKSYFSFKDLNSFSADQLISFMKVLQERGYNGGVKIFQDLTEQGTKLNDQVVMHGFSEQDAKLALEVAKEFFAHNIGHTSLGKDEIINGKSESYSKLLAQKIKEQIHKK